MSSSRGGRVSSFVNTYTLAFQREPRVAMNDHGGFVVVWESYYQDGGYAGIFGQRFDAAASPVGTEFQVNSYTTSDQSGASVASGRAGSFVVAWTSYGQESPLSMGIYAQRFDATGPVGPEFRVNTVTSGTRSAFVTADTAGAFTVAWMGSDGSGVGIRGQRYDATGTAIGGEFPVNALAPGDQSEPVLAADANANVIAAWSSSSQDGSGSAVAANRLDCDGQALGPDFLVNTYTTGSQNEPSIASASGDFVVVWRSADQDGSGDGVYAQRFRGLPACGRFHTVTPCRLADTRLPDGPSGGPPLAAGASRDFPVGGACGIPADARAVAVNVTTTAQTRAGNLRLYPAGEPVPLASAINFTAQHARANNAVVRLGTNGQVGVRCDMTPGPGGTTQFILDVTGYFR